METNFHTIIKHHSELNPRPMRAMNVAPRRSRFCFESASASLVFVPDLLSTNNDVSNPGTPHTKASTSER